MHFLFEAFYRRSLEPRSLVYSRGATAVIMAAAFLTFVGYLISQIVHDKPLIQISSEIIDNEVDAPVIEVCVQNSTWIAIHCAVMYLDWSVAEIPNCMPAYFRGGEEEWGTRCHTFESKSDFRMTTGDSKNPQAVRRLDFYWSVGSLDNMTYASITDPAIAIKLYHPSFNPWYGDSIGTTPVEQMTKNNIALGLSRATSPINQSAGLFYYQERYRAIEPGSVSATFGLTPDYIDINTLPTTQLTWPLNDSPNTGFGKVPRDQYQGYFSVQLSRSNIEIKTEVRQHTILASVALAGGAYGIITTLYILFFGMNRMTPWGLVHHVPAFLSRKKHADEDLNDELSIQGDSSLSLKPDAKPTRSYSRIFLPWFFRRPLQRTNSQPTNPAQSVFKNMISQRYKHPEEFSMHTQPESSMEFPSHDQIPPYMQAYMQSLVQTESRRRLQEEEKKTRALELRVNELEVILREYFIDTLYLDEIRTKGPQEKERE